MPVARRIVAAAAAPTALLVALVGATLRTEVRRREAPAFDADYALGVAQRIARLGPRVPGSAEHAEARAVILRELHPLPDVSVETQTTRHGKMLNVFAGRGPTDPARRPVIVGAHYDSVPGSPGAADDAAGVGIVLALARAVAPRSGVVFTLWDGEEQELAGSAGDADARAAAGTLPGAVISFDLVGWSEGRTVLHTFRDGVWAARDLASARLVRGLLDGAAVAGNDVSVGDPAISLVYQVLTRLVRLPFDADDGSYARHGVPALFVSDSSFTRFDPAYHQPGDTPETLSRESIGRAGRMVAAFLRHRIEDDSDWIGGEHDTRTWVAFGRRVISGVAVVVIDVLAALPLLLALRFRAGRGRRAVLLVAYAVAAALEPAAALVLLGPAVWITWLRGDPEALAAGWGRRPRTLAADAIALLMPILCLVVFAAAIYRFGWHWPRLGIGAAVAHAGAILAIAGSLGEAGHPDVAK